MHLVHRLPFVRILIPFILGITISYYFTLSIAIVITCVLLSLLGIILFRMAPFSIRQKIPWSNGLAIHAVLFSVACLVSNFHEVKNHKQWYGHQSHKESKLQATLLAPLSETARTYKTIAEVKRIYYNKVAAKACGKVVLYFSKNDPKPKLNTADEIIFCNKLNPIMSRGNPGEFDYAAFSSNRGIYEQAFLNQNEWEKLNSSDSRTLSLFQKAHEKIKDILRQYIPGKDANGIAQALITGYRDDIKEETFKDYTRTGLVHLLAISGLHMGIFYLGAQFLLGLIPFFKRRKKLLIICSLLGIWLFALITTFPPSVQRASVMFTFLGLGQLINRKTSSINFLAASAFFLLLLQPHLLFEVGFQLSYTAVLGILLFYKPIHNWFFPNNLIASKAWQIMSVSLAAQLFTFPLVIYYFHQFPTLFLLTNLIAIPAITIIIYGEILLILFSFLPEIAKLIGLLLDKIIYGLNQFIHFTAGLSFVSISNITISFTQCMLLFVLLALATIYLLANKKSFLITAIACLSIFLGIQVSKRYKALLQKQVVIYNYQSPYLEYHNGQQFYTKDTVAQQYKNSFNTYVRQTSHNHFSINKELDRSPSWNEHKQFDLLDFDGSFILRIKKAYKLKGNKKARIDYLVLSDPWIRNAKEFVSQFECNELIIDGNIPMWKIQLLKSELREVDLPTHYVALDGAKIISL